jgi:hypothetical protein
MKIFNNKNKLSTWAITLLIIGFGMVDTANSFSFYTDSDCQEKEKKFLKLHKSVLAPTVGLGKFIVDTENTISSLEGRGPTSSGELSLREQMKIDVPPEFDWNQIFSLSSTVYPDINGKSKIYYYLPGKHFLAWDKEDGYLLRFYYKGEVTPGEQNKIHIDLWLTPGHQPKDYQLLKKLIQIHKGIEIKELLRLPADYRLNLHLGEHLIPEDQITISGIDTDTGELHITVETDVVTKQMLEDQLKDLGWGGTMNITPASYSAEEPSVPAVSKAINIRLCDREAFTQKEWVRRSGEFTTFTNEYDFPLRLKRLYFLRKTKSKSTPLKVYGFELGDVVLAPEQSVKIRNSNIPEVLEDSNTLKAWYDFRLVPDDEYLNQMMTVITGGVGEVPIKTLSLVAVNAGEIFDRYNIFEISVQVSSINFDPKGEKRIIKKYKLTRDNPEATGDPLYLLGETGDEESGGLGSLFKYKISIIDNDANRYTDEIWREGEEEEETVYIGGSHIKELMGIKKESTGEEAEITESKTETAESESSELMVSSISPSSVSEGQAFVLKVYGSGFQLGTKVYIEVNVNAGTELEPEYGFMEFDCVFIESSQIQISFDRGFGADPKERKIYVQNPDSRQSNTVILKILS